MAQPAAKLSVSIPGELAAAVRKRVGARGLSGFVARAVAHELEREGIAVLLDQLEQQLGPPLQGRARSCAQSMAEALILDAEVLNALASPTERSALAKRAAAVLRLAHQRRALVRVPAPVLAEVCRGVRYDSAVNHLLNNPGVGVLELTRTIAQQAGHLLARFKLSSAHAVDAFVVATAAQFDTAVIATADAEDIRRLAAPFSKIGVFSL